MALFLKEKLNIASVKVALKPLQKPTDALYSWSELGDFAPQTPCIRLLPLISAENDFEKFPRQFLFPASMPDT